MEEKFKSKAGAEIKFTLAMVLAGVAAVMIATENLLGILVVAAVIIFVAFLFKATYYTFKAFKRQRIVY